MSEQRFTFDYEVEFEIFDRVTKKHYDGRVGCQEKICDLLNEQQATISALKDIFKDIIAYSEWDSEKPYCSLGITVDKKTYYEIRKILNE